MSSSVGELGRGSSTSLSLVPATTSGVTCRFLFDVRSAY